MDRFYNTNYNNSKVVGSNSNTSSSYDPQRDHQSIQGRPPSPDMNPIFGSNSNTSSSYDPLRNHQSMLGRPPSPYMNPIFDSTSNASSSYDPLRNHQSMLGRPPSPYMNPILDSQFLDPYSMDPMIRNTRAAAGFPPSPGQMYQYPAIDSSRFNSHVYQNYQPHHHHPNFSSGGSSSSSRLSAIDRLEMPPSRSPPVLVTPVRDNEGNVVAMDGILVSSHGGRRKPGYVSDSSFASSSRRRILYKTETCRHWDFSGYCHFGSACQFAHGKDELRPLPSRYSQRIKIEPPQPPICESFKAGTCIHGNKCPFIHNNVMMKEWSPSDEGIIEDQIRPTRAAVDAPLPRRPRLPVFTKICPDQ